MEEGNRLIHRDEGNRLIHREEGNRLIQLECRRKLLSLRLRFSSKLHITLISLHRGLENCLFYQFCRCIHMATNCPCSIQISVNGRVY